LSVASTSPVAFTIALRLPDWCSAPRAVLNGEPVVAAARRGYLYLTRVWSMGDQIQLTLPMPVRRVRSNPLVRQNLGKVALQRGPLVYCLEQADNGANLHQLRLARDADFRLASGEGVLAGKTLIQAPGDRASAADADQKQLYRYDGEAPQRQPQPLVFIPYFCWANRGEGEMRVWIEEQA
jgi:hypothetical protein